MDAAWGLIAGTGWASGISLYGAVLVLGLLGRNGADGVPEVLTRPEVLAVAGVLYAAEFVIDKIPYLDNVWDAIHTVIRPLGAALVGASVADVGDVAAVVGASTGGGLALAAHATKTSLRLAVNTSPEPASNIVVSVIEDVVGAGVIFLATEHPGVAIAVVVVLVISGVAVIVAVLAAVRAGIGRLRARLSRRRARHTA